MEYTSFPPPPQHVSRIGLGTWAIGGDLWGARQPSQLPDMDQVLGWKLDTEDFLKIDRILERHITEPASLSFMAPPVSSIS